MPIYDVNGDNKTVLPVDEKGKGTVVEISGNNNTVIANTQVSATRFVFVREGQQTYLGGAGQDLVTYGGGKLIADGGKDGSLFGESQDTLRYAPNDRTGKPMPPMNLQISFDAKGAMSIKNLATNEVEVKATEFEKLELSHIGDTRVATVGLKIDELQAKAKAAAGSINIKFDGERAEIDGHGLSAKVERVQITR
jgi:hypothetical protein